MLKHLNRITFNPKIMAGKACIRGMRIPVSFFLVLRGFYLIIGDRIF